MKFEIVVKEFPFLEYFQELIEDLKVRRMGPEVLTIELFKNEHSWAGDEGCLAWVYCGQWKKLPYGGWYSDNGEIVKETEPFRVWEALDKEDILVLDVQALLVKTWSTFQGSQFESWVLYVRPRKKEILDEYSRLMRLEINRLLEEVG